MCAFALLTSACTNSGTTAEEDTSPPASVDDGQTGSGTTALDTTASTTTTTTTTATATAPLGRGFETCSQVEVVSGGRAERVDLDEASGLAASRSHPGVIWAVNDSGNEAGVFAVDLDGADRGFFRAVTADGPEVEAVDVEDMAFYDGSLYLADIGDNRSVRDGVTIYVVDEPTPGEDGTAVVRQRIELQYPTGATDAEAFLVDPITGDLVILGKKLDDTMTRIYTAPLPSDQQPAREPLALELAGTFDLTDFPSKKSQLTPAALLYPGAVTAADISDDGSLIAVRTYGTVWLFPRLEGSVVEALAGQPCEGGTAREGQGESLALLNQSDGDAGQVHYVTMSEGEQRPVNVVTVEPGQ